MDQDAPLIVLERNRVAAPLLNALMALGLGGFGAFLLFHLAPGSLGLHLFVIAAVFRYLGLRENHFAKSVERKVEVTSAGVRVDDRVIPRSEISDGWFRPRAKQSTVRLVDRRRNVLFEAQVATEAEAVAILRKLGLDASRRRATFNGASPIGQSQVYSTMTVLAGFLASAGARMLFPHAFLFTLLFAVAAFSFVFVPAKIDVGIDGVLVRWMGRRTFLPLSSILHVRAEGETAIHFDLGRGKSHLLLTATGKQRHSGGVYREHRDMILARIREALAIHRAKGPAEIALLLARGSRSVTEWRESLVKLGSADAGYREASLREEDLWRVVEDPRADEDARAGAALVLRSRLDDEGKARVRIAAEASVSPKLRIALEKTSDGTEEEAFEALERFDPRRRASAG